MTDNRNNRNLAGRKICPECGMQITPKWYKEHMINVHGWGLVNNSITKVENSGWHTKAKPPEKEAK